MSVYYLSMMVILFITELSDVLSLSEFLLLQYLQRMFQVQYHYLFQALIETSTGNFENQQAVLHCQITDTIKLLLMELANDKRIATDVCILSCFTFSYKLF